MAKYYGKYNQRESFVYTPNKPSCLMEDGSCDYEKLNALMEAALQGDKGAQMLVFEQYQGFWKKLVNEFKTRLGEFTLDTEDLQQEVFYSYLESLKNFGERDWKKFKGFYETVGRHNFLDIIRRQSKLVDANYFLCSLDLRDEEGNLIHDIADNNEGDYFRKEYPQIESLLTEQELKIVIARYVDCNSIGAIAATFQVSVRSVNYMLKSIKEKLKTLVK